MKQELPTLPEHMSSPTVFSGVRVAQILAFCVVCCRSMFVLLSFFILPSCCLSIFNLRLLIYPFSTFKLQERKDINRRRTCICLIVLANNIGVKFKLTEHVADQLVCINDRIFQQPLSCSNCLGNNYILSVIFWNLLVKCGIFLTTLNFQLCNILYSVTFSTLFYQLTRIVWITLLWSTEILYKSFISNIDLFLTHIPFWRMTLCIFSLKNKSFFSWKQQSNYSSYEIIIFN